MAEKKMDSSLPITAGPQVQDGATKALNTFTASAAKRGRFAGKPYVPVVIHDYVGPAYAVPKRWTQQIRPFAFATRDEAVAYAEKHIAANATNGA